VFRFASWTWYGALALVGLTLALGQVWIRLQVVAVGYQLSNTRQLIHSLERERQTLRMQWSALTTPIQLAAQAERRLGMSAPEPERVVRVP
jgi:cell division protein FtsL